MTRRKVGAAPLGDVVELVDRVLGPASLHDVPIPHPDHDVSATLTYDGEKYVCNELVVRKRPDGPPVSSTTMRRLTLVESLRQATFDAVKPNLVVRGTATNERGQLVFDADPRRGRINGFYLPREVKGHGPTDDALSWVARIYRVAYAVGWEPRQQVALSFGIPADTASDWIRRARRAGLLGQTTPGKAGT